MSENVKVRVLSRVKRNGKLIAAGSEITIPREEYDARRKAEAADSMLTPLYLSVEEHAAAQAVQEQAQTQKEGAGNARHAQVKASMQEANRIAKEAAVLRMQKDAERAKELADAAQARSDKDKPQQRRGRPPLTPAS